MVQVHCIYPQTDPGNMIVGLLRKSTYAFTMQGTSMHHPCIGWCIHACYLTWQITPNPHVTLHLRSQTLSQTMRRITPFIERRYEMCACWEISGWSLMPQSTFHHSSRPLTQTSFLNWHDDAQTNHEVFVDIQSINILESR